jgi:hypothetical protein
VKENSRTTGRVTIGIDLGDRRSDVCILNESGVVMAHTKAATTEHGLSKALKRHLGARVILEVGTHSPWVSRLLEGLGHEVIVANPSRVRRIAGKETKSDQIDAPSCWRGWGADPRCGRSASWGAGAAGSRAAARCAMG